MLAEPRTHLYRRGRPAAYNINNKEETGNEVGKNENTTPEISANIPGEQNGTFSGNNDIGKISRNVDEISSNSYQVPQNVVNAADKKITSEDSHPPALEKVVEQPLEFEPLYMVDYFASQGIKLAEDNLPNDKLGTQLKSFTEWIKSMKKIHVQKIQEEDPQTDNKIQGIAAISNEETEVLTEAMADVLVKQDKIGKAIELYEKLSLNNPSKSAYFASKIESLKSV